MESNGSPNNVEPRTCQRKQPVQVAIGSPRRDLVAALVARLDAEPGFAPAGYIVAHPRELLWRIEKRSADVVLLDERLIRYRASRITRALRDRLRRLGVLLLCDRVRAGLIDEIIDNRFEGYLLTKDAVATCARACSVASRGSLWLPREQLEKTIFQLRRGADARSPRIASQEMLTRRENQAVAYVCQGLSNKQIANRLGIKEDTVKKHLLNIYGKLGIRRRAQLIAHEALRSGERRGAD